MARRNLTRVHAMTAATPAVASEFGVLQVAVAADRQIVVRSVASGSALALAVENLAAGVTITSPSTPVHNGNFSPDSGPPTSAVTKGTTAAAPAADAFRVGGNTSFNEGFVVGPGRVLVIRGVTNNTAASLSLVIEEQDLSVSAN